MDVDLKPTPRKLREFGLVAFVVFGLLSILAQRELFVFRGGLGEARAWVVAALAAVAVLSALFSLIAPAANRPLFVGLTLAAFPLGWVVSHVLLAALFLGIVTPIALVLRLRGWDALRLTRHTTDSYWVKARPARSVRDYFRQF